MVANVLRLAIFGANCSSGRTYATLPERWVASWENNLRLAQLADEIGIEAMVPIARWKGYGGQSNPNDVRYEQGEEWWSIVKRIWAGEAPFAFEGTHYRLRGVEGSPAPYGERVPRMMNAGSSETGRLFAIRHSDMHFDAVETPEASTARIAETK